LCLKKKYGQSKLKKTLEKIFAQKHKQYKNEHQLVPKLSAKLKQQFYLCWLIKSVLKSVRVSSLKNIFSLF